MQRLHAKSDIKWHILLNSKCFDIIYTLFVYYTIVKARFMIISFSNIHYDGCIRTDDTLFYSTLQMHFQPEADDNGTVAKVIRYSAVLLHKPWAPRVCAILRSYAGGIWLPLIIKGERKGNKSKRPDSSWRKPQMQDCFCIYEGKTDTRSSSSLQDLSWILSFH